MRFQRLINTRDLEFYMVTENKIRNEVFGYLIIYDKRGRAELRDFTVFYKSNMKEEVFKEGIKRNHIYAMFFSFTDLEENSEIPKFKKVISFIEDLLEFKPETSYYVDNYLIDRKLKFKVPSEYEKISQFADYLVKVSGRDIPIPKVNRNNYLFLSQ